MVHLPNRPKKRSVVFEVLCKVLIDPEPRSNQMDSVPDCLMIRLISSVIRSRASFQEIGSNSPAFLGPILFMGCMRRVEAFTTFSCANPLRQALRCSPFRFSVPI